MTVVGADADAVAACGQRFAAAAESLQRIERQLDALFTSTVWFGPDARRHRTEWVASARAIAATAGFVDALAADLRAQAGEQRRAAGVEHVTPSGWRAPPSGPDLTTRSDALGGRRPERFTAPVDHRAAVVAAMVGLADPDRIRFDEIEIRALDNGRYVVVLPGVTDLSDGLGAFVDRVRSSPLDAPGATHDLVETWSDNDAPTVRKMRHAVDAALHDDHTTNPYSAAAIDALREAGVPSGAEVMLVGHSFGAYTAVDLAADATVNLAHGTEHDGYRLDITHVVAAGAETDWRFQELPEGTATLVINNRVDAVYRAEDLLHRGGLPEHRSHVEIEFWGGWSGYGHDESHYIDELRESTNRELTDWLEHAGADYASAGTRVSVEVPDPAS